MLPLFDSDTRKRRPINLGGASGSASGHSTDLLQEARNRRLARDADRRRADAAARIQAWWRAVCARRVVRAALRERLRADVRGLDGLRCLVLLARAGGEHESLALWAGAMADPGENCA
jgi:ubiquitin-protein ligase E3 C